MAQSRTVKGKKDLLVALESTLGVVTLACKSAKIDRGTFYNWMEDDEEFAAAVKEMENVALDFAESQLHKQIKDGTPSSTIFYLKTKGKKRGYIERQEIVGDKENPVAQFYVLPNGTKLEF